MSENTEGYYRELIQRIRRDFLKMDDDLDIVGKFEEELSGLEIVPFVSLLYRTESNAMVSNLLQSMPIVVIGLELKWIVQIFHSLQNDVSILLGFVFFMQGTYGIDFVKLSQSDPEIEHRIKSLLEKQISLTDTKPNSRSRAWLAEIGINQADLIEKMRSQGAPIVE